MPYCSIEEAWGQDFFDNQTKSTKFKKILHDKQENNTNEKYKDIKKKKTFSRTYNRLPKHSGPKTRLPINNIKSFKKINTLSDYDTQNNNDIKSVNDTLSNYDTSYNYDTSSNHHLAAYAI